MLLALFAAPAQAGLIQVDYAGVVTELAEKAATARTESDRSPVSALPTARRMADLVAALPSRLASLPAASQQDAETELTASKAMNEQAKAQKAMAEAQVMPLQGFV